MGCDCYKRFEAGEEDQDVNQDQITRTAELFERAARDLRRKAEDPSYTPDYTAGSFSFPEKPDRWDSLLLKYILGIVALGGVLSLLVFFLSRG